MLHAWARRQAPGRGVLGALLLLFPRAVGVGRHRCELRREPLCGGGLRDALDREVGDGIVVGGLAHPGEVGVGIGPERGLVGGLVGIATFLGVRASTADPDNEKQEPGRRSHDDIVSRPTVEANFWPVEETAVIDSSRNQGVAATGSGP